MFWGAFAGTLHIIRLELEWQQEPRETETFLGLQMKRRRALFVFGHCWCRQMAEIWITDPFMPAVNGNVHIGHFHPISLPTAHTDAVNKNKPSKLLSASWFIGWPAENTHRENVIGSFNAVFKDNICGNMTLLKATLEDSLVYHLGMTGTWNDCDSHMKDCAKPKTFSTQRY